MSALSAALDRTPVLGILRGLTTTDAEAVGAVLFEAGIAAIEVPLNRPGALEAVSRLAAVAPSGVAIGVGTLTDPSQLPDVVAAGAGFAVSPHLDLSLVERCAEAGIETVPGVMTASELYAAYRAGVRTAKLFPYDGMTTAGVAGLMSIAPNDLAIMAVGGVDADNAARILAAGASSVGVGSWLYRPGDTADAVRAKAAHLIDAIDRAGDAR